VDESKFENNFSKGDNEYFLRQTLDNYAIYDVMTSKGKNNGLVLVKNPINLDDCNFNKTWWFEGNLNNIIKKHKELTSQNNTNLDWNFNNKILNIEENAKRILDDNPLYFDEHKRWWKWENNKWLEIKEHHILNFIKEAYSACGLSSNNNRNSMINAIKDETVNRRPEEPKETWIQIGNTIFDISSDGIIFPSHNYFIKNVLPYSIGANENTPKIDKLFNDWMGEDKDILYDICAYCISPTLFLDLIVFLIGRGSNGKGVFTKILNKLLGDSNTSSKSIELLADSKGRFQTNALLNKYLLNLGDGNSTEIKDTKLLKELAGGQDKIPAEIKGGGHLEFYNKAMLLGSFNTLPVCKDKTDGWYRRLMLVQFKNQFEPEEVFRDIPEEEYENLMLKSLNRLKEIYKTRKIKGVLSINDTKKLYEELSNPITIFLKKETQDDIKGAVTGNKLYQEYKKFAVLYGFNEFSYQEFISRFESIGVYDKKRMYVYYDEVKKYCYRDYDKIPVEFNHDGQKTHLTVYAGLSFINQYSKNTQNTKNTPF